jgi:transcriptional regulator with XRE-family HTH domain
MAERSAVTLLFLCGVRLRTILWTDFAEQKRPLFPSAPIGRAGSAKMETLDKLVRHARARQGLTQDELAKATGTTVSRISRIERASELLGFPKAPKLAKALGLEHRIVVAAILQSLVQRAGLKYDVALHQNGSSASSRSESSLKFHVCSARVPAAIPSKRSGTPHTSATASVMASAERRRRYAREK